MSICVPFCSQFFSGYRVHGIGIVEIVENKCDIENIVAWACVWVRVYGSFQSGKMNNAK